MVKKRNYPEARLESMKIFTTCMENMVATMICYVKENSLGQRDQYSMPEIRIGNL